MEAAEAGSCRTAARGVMSASGAVQPGPPGATVGPSPAATGSPATGPLFRPLSAEDEEQQPTEIESLCMNCYRNVSLGRGRPPRRAPRGSSDIQSADALKSFFPSLLLLP